MPAITVQKEARTVTIRRRQNGLMWLVCMPYLLLLCFEIAVPIAAVYRLLADLLSRQTMHPTSLLAGVLFALKAWWFGMFLYRTLGARSVLIVRGDTLQISRGQFHHLADIGTYSAGTLSDLSLESGRNLLIPAGRLQAKIGDIPVVLAECVSDTDGGKLIDELCEAYPFSTPEPATSPAVISWDSTS